VKLLEENNFEATGMLDGISASTDRPERRVGRGLIYDSILDTVGSTPLVRLRKVEAHFGLAAELTAKCEFLNPLTSAKDRVGLAMVEAADAEGRIGPSSTIIEATSGNTGLALAFVCAAKGYRLILTMPATMPAGRRKMLALLGAQVEFTPADLGMQGAIARAEALHAEMPDSFIPRQFSNPANPEIHRGTTAEEIWSDTNGRVDVLVAGVGTGGTLTGVASVIKARNPKFKAVGVEPEESPVLSGGLVGPHEIEGIGAGFVPPVLNLELVDEIVRISGPTAINTARLVARLEGLPVGISSGAAIAASVEIDLRPDMQGKLIVVVAPSSAERYLGTSLFEGIDHGDNR
jgi:cysteine synthase A